MRTLSKLGAFYLVLMAAPGVALADDAPPGTPTSQPAPKAKPKFQPTESAPGPVAEPVEEPVEQPPTGAPTPSAAPSAKPKREPPAGQVGKKSIYELDPAPHKIVIRPHRLIFRSTFGLGQKLSASSPRDDVVGEGFDGASMPSSVGWQFEYNWLAGRYFLMGAYFGMLSTRYADGEDVPSHWVIDMGMSMRLRIPITVFHRDFIEILIGAYGGMSFPTAGKDDVAGFQFTETSSLSVFMGGTVAPTVTVGVNVLRWLHLFIEAGWQYHINTYTYSDEDVRDGQETLAYSYHGAVLNLGLALWY